MENITNGNGNTPSSPSPQLIIDDLRVMMRLAVVVDDQVVQKIDLPEGRGQGVPLRFNPEAFQQAYEWAKEEFNAWKARLPALSEREPVAAEDEAEPANVVRLPEPLGAL